MKRTLVSGLRAGTRTQKNGLFHLSWESVLGDSHFSLLCMCVFPTMTQMTQHCQAGDQQSCLPKQDTGLGYAE